MKLASEVKARMPIPTIGLTGVQHITMGERKRLPANPDFEHHAGQMGRMRHVGALYLRSIGILTMQEGDPGDLGIARIIIGKIER